MKDSKDVSYLGRSKNRKQDSYNGDIELEDSVDLKVLILDTSAFLAGYSVRKSNESIFTVPSVREEIKEGTINRLRFENAITSGTLKVIEPENIFRDQVQKVLINIGDDKILSETDIQIISLGLQLKTNGLTPTIISDDYAIQNAADKLGFDFQGLMTPGIKRRYKWITYCPGCKKSFKDSPINRICSVCGTKLKRRPLVERKIE
jgi:UPF0271 protein